jgi:hypothetical protein
LFRQIYSTDMDLFPDAQNETLTVRLHHLQAAHQLGDGVVRSGFLAYESVAGRDRRRSAVAQGRGVSRPSV